MQVRNCKHNDTRTHVSLPIYKIASTLLRRVDVTALVELNVGAWQDPSYRHTPWKLRWKMICPIPFRTQQVNQCLGAALRRVLVGAVVVTKLRCLIGPVLS